MNDVLPNKRLKLLAARRLRNESPQLKRGPLACDKSVRGDIATRSDSNPYPRIVHLSLSLHGCSERREL